MIEDRSFRAPQGRQRLDRLLVTLLPELSRSRIQALIAEGHVQVEGRLVKSSFRPEAGEEIRVVIPDISPSSWQPEDLGLHFYHRDAHLAVVHKPAGIVVHPDNSHRSGTLVHGLLHALEGLSAIGGEERPGIVHRLDKGTSGVMVVACTDQAHRGLQEQFSDHSIERRYRALVLGAPDLDAGVIRSEIGRSPRDRMRMASVSKGGRRAVTHWKVIERFPQATLVECRLETGRTHQVRVHLSEQGTPILGDTVYHARRTVPPGLKALLEPVDHPLLHAAHLGLQHPESGEWMAWDAPLPADFSAVLDKLRES